MKTGRDAFLSGYCPECGGRNFKQVPHLASDLSADHDSTPSVDIKCESCGWSGEPDEANYR